MNRIKLIFVGEGKVGKTSLISQYTEKKFDEEYTMTVGNDKVYKELEINNKKISLEIWDTPGQKEFNAVSKIFMKNAKIAIIVYSIIDKKSFENLNKWLNMLKEINKNDDLVIGIVANKSDLFENQIVSKEEGEKFAKDNNVLFFETSAKDYNSINKVFLELCKSYLKNFGKNIPSTTQQINNDDKKDIKKENLEPLENVDENINDINIEKDPNSSSSKCNII